MIAAPALRRAAYAGAWRLFGVGLLLLLSLIAVAFAILMQQYAAVAAVGCVIAAATVWRPRYGIYAVVILALAFEATNIDALMFPGLIAQNDFSTWSPLHFVVFTPIEALIGLVALLVVAGAVADRRLPRRGQVLWPIAIFAGLLLAAAAYGRIKGGGSLNIALWEIRSLAVCCLLAVLVPTVLRKREHVNTLLNLLVLGAVWMSIDIIIRRYTVLLGVNLDNVALAYGHETPVYLNVVILLLVGRLIWPASRGAKLSALLLPLLLYAEALTERRAGWVTLDVGLILTVILIFRMKRRTFWLLVVPLALLYAGYLVGFWNANGTLAQPARAVRSLNSPDARDASSDLYRKIEITDIRANIKAHPLTGLGMGQPYAMPVPLTDLSAGWPFWHYETHDALLWVWMTMGPIGFVAFLTLIGVAIARGIQLLKRARNSPSAPALMALVGALLMITVYSYVDIGLTSVRTCVLLGFAIGVIAAWGRDAAPEEVAESEAAHAAAAARALSTAGSGFVASGSWRRAGVRAAPLVEEFDPYPRPATAPSHTVARGAFALLLAQPLTWAASLATVVVFPHYLGASGLGIFAVAYTFSTLLATVAACGVPSLLVRQVAERPDDARGLAVDAFVVLTGFAAVGAAVSWVVAALVIHDTILLDATRVLLVAGVFGVGAAVLYSYLNGRGRHRLFAWISTASTVVVAAIQIAILVRGGSLHQLVLATAVVTAVGCLPLWVVCGLPLPRRLPTAAHTLDLVRAGLPFLAWDVIRTVRARADVIMIAALIGAAAAGWLSAAYRIVAIPLFVATAVATPLLPALSRSQQDRPAFRSTLFKSLQWVILLSLPGSVGIAIIAPRIPGLLHWPQDFVHAVVPLRILAIQPTIVAIDVIMGTAIFAVHRERRWLVVAVAGALFAVGANFAAQPLAQHLTGNGASGAAWVELGTESLFFVGALILLPDSYRPAGLPLMMLQAALCGLAMLAVGLVLLPRSLPLAIVASTATYAAAIVLTGFVRPRQLREMVTVLIQQAES